MVNSLELIFLPLHSLFYKNDVQRFISSCKIQIITQSCCMASILKPHTMRQLALVN